jgi:hypothetical protein
MAYLTTTDYNGFIASAIQPDRGKIDLYFQSLYKEHEQDNKVDFFDRLISIILDLVEQFNKHKENYINDKADMLDIQRALSIEGKTFSKRTLDSIQNLNWDKIPFHYENGKIWEIERVNSVKIYEFDIRNLLRGVESFRSLLNNNGSIELNDSNRIKLKWKGSKTQLYYLLNKLKFGDNLITNKYEDIAKFIIENVEGYEEDSLITTKENLEKGKYPKKGENFSGTLIEIKDIE